MKKRNKTLNRFIIIIIIILLAITLFMVIKVNKFPTGNVVQINSIFYADVTCNQVSEGIEMEGTSRLVFSEGCTDTVDNFFPSNCKVYDKNKWYYRNRLLAPTDEVIPGNKYKIQGCKDEILKYQNIFSLEQEEQIRNLDEEPTVEINDYTIFQGSEDNIIDELSLSATPGEFEPTTFTINPPENLHDITIEASDLTFQGNTIPRPDVRVVKKWFQNGRDSRANAERILIEELLVYKDKEKLTGGYDISQGDMKPGIIRNGLDTTNTVFHKNTEIINPDKGAIDLWIKPQFEIVPSEKTNEIALINGNDGGSIRIYISKDGELIGRYNNLIPLEDTCPKPDPVYTTASCKIQASEALTKDQFSRLTFTWDINSGVQLFIDGEELNNINCKNDGISAITFVQPLAIGGNVERTTFQGIVDELRVFNYPISTTEIDSNEFRNEPIVYQSFDQLNTLSTGRVRAFTYKYNPPTISHDLLTEIAKEDSKKFWITQKIPEDALPGTYTGEITIKSSNAPDKTLTLSVQVLPFTLDEPSQDRIMWLTNIPEDPESIRYALNDIYDHGFRGLKVNQKSTPLREEKAEELQRLIDGGLSPNKWTDPIMQTDRKYNLRNLVDSGFEDYRFGVDEANNDEKLAIHVGLSRKHHDSGAKVGTFILKESADRLRNPSDKIYTMKNPETCTPFNLEGTTNEELDLAIYHATNLPKENRGADSNLWDYILKLRSGEIQKDTDYKELYYSQSWQEHPNLQRMMSGYFAHLSKLDGFAFWSYQIKPSLAGVGTRGGSNDPYDEFDGTAGRNNLLTFYKDKSTTYPAKGESISTVQWESIREGIDDLRYLTTLLNLLDILKEDNPEMAEEIETQLTSEIAKYSDPIDHITLTNNDFKTTREFIIQKILEIQAINEPAVVEEPIQEPTNNNPPNPYTTLESTAKYHLSLFNSNNQEFIDTTKSFSFSERTYSFAIKPTTTEKQMIVFSGSDNNYPRARITLDGVLKYQFRIGGSLKTVKTPINTMNKNRWQYIVITHDNSNLVSMYVDGTKFEKQFGAGGVDSGSKSLHVGGAANIRTRTTKGEFFKGKIKNLNIFDRVLNAAEVSLASNYCKTFDKNNDGRINFGDQSSFADCYSGYTDISQCAWADWNNNNDVDNTDFAIFGQCFDT